MLYNSLKYFVKKIIPVLFIKRHDLAIRKCISIFYIGKNYQCNICGFWMTKFIKIGKADKLCVRCGSRSRTRRLWEFLENKTEEKTILHFSPSNSIKTKLEASKNANYITTDYSGEFQALKTLDIEAIDEPDNKYDIIICFHVLEHIQNDIKAMKELYRITKPDGLCIIQTPFKSGDIYEDDSIKTEADRLKHFGQKDHLRIYSVNGLKERLHGVGFSVKLNEYTNKEGNIHGFSIHEKFLLATKKSSLY